MLTPQTTTVGRAWDCGLPTIDANQETSSGQYLDTTVVAAVAGICMMMAGGGSLQADGHTDPERLGICWGH